MLSNMITLLDSINITLSSNILSDIQFNLNKIKSANNHISFLINNNGDVISYEFNSYLISKKFPYSMHSEINTLIKYYKRRNTKKNTKCKKIFIIIKISKTGKLGLSRPCRNCAAFISNNFKNLNLCKIYYSNLDKFEELSKNDLDNDQFTISSGFKKTK